MALVAEDFPRFFKELWGFDPFPWQVRLIQEVVKIGWRDCIDLPTASGKTACLDVAVFALALQGELAPEERTLGRRIFFVVNRRVIVDEAYERARKIATKLLDSKPGPIIKLVAAALCRVSGDVDAPPLDVAMLRGGIVRDNRWARSITQPTIITSTIDQVGSRLLFRGYGVSDAAKPLHAALIAHDSLLLLDEAHICQPFVQTLEELRRYRGANWCRQEVKTPFHFVQMTATPGVAESPPFRLDTEDRTHPVLKKRHDASKPVKLIEAGNAKGKKALEALSKEIAAQAIAQISDTHCNIAIVVNRILTARMIVADLRDAKQPEVHLVIGRMRPLDRDALTRTIQTRVGNEGVTRPDASPMFVVATQALEVGADYDFDAMVTECASMDALRQRFGRLNRQGRDIDARGAIVVRADQAEEADDPIYGTALSKTWEWLKQLADDDDIVDFGVNTLNEALKDADMTPLSAPRLDAPVMFPAYVDVWAQTNPIPTPDPEVSLFIHGPERGEPDVQVCWREDLDDFEKDKWPQVISLCPPSSPECMTVPIGSVRQWLANEDAEDEEQSDLLDAKTPVGTATSSRQMRSVVLWRGLRESKVAESPHDLRPGDTVVVPVSEHGWEVFGHIPENAPPDIAERARKQSAGITVLRLWKRRLTEWPASEERDQLLSWLDNPDDALRNSDLRPLMRQLADDASNVQGEFAKAMRTLGANKFGFRVERYPGGKGAVFSTTRRDIPRSILPAMDDGDDRTSISEIPVNLPDHLEHVVQSLDASLALLPLAELAQAFCMAAAMHDWGKADERFQAMLSQGNLMAARARKIPLAKSGGMPESGADRRRAAGRCGYPRGFRHEMVSVQMAELAPERLPKDEIQRELVLHLIATHHGYGRPFSPVIVDDDAPPDVVLRCVGVEIQLSADMRRNHPPHRLDSGIAERFWRLTRHYGWWGLAYLEAVLRLADQRASQKESEGFIPSDHEQLVEATHG